MTQYIISLAVMPKENILDPAGVAVKNTLQDMGFDQLQSVVLGKLLYITVKATDEAAAKKMALAMGKELLAHEAMEVATLLSVVKGKG
ncbi:MAG: phosphoribosylformylglycinamidine synthase subunit PurS [Alphaproteobacteria bacterium]|nr:phosphoribosylformylglycinamidine synthase subunit PurS [Alphaproteobacteria bacterium]